MSLENLADNASWVDVLSARASELHRHLAALLVWVDQAGGDEELLNALCAPYEHLLTQIYQDDMPLARAMELSDLLIHIKGPAVEASSPSIALISGIFQSVRKQVGSVAYAIAGILDRTTLPREVDLGLAAFAHGSLYLGFSLPPPDFEYPEGDRSLLGNQDPLFTATREALRVLGAVTRSLNSDQAEAEIAAAVPDPKIRDTAITAIQRIAPSGRKGIDAIEIGGRSMGTSGFTELTPAVRKTIRSMVEHPVTSLESGEFVGVVREIDLDVRRFEIRRIEQSEIEEIRVIYPESLDHLAERLTNRKVRVAGQLERSPEGKLRLVQASDVTLIQEEDGGTKPPS